MRVIGLMSGTSMDGIDVAVAQLTGADSGDLSMRLLGHRTLPWPGELRRRLLALLPPASTTIAEVAQLDVLIGQQLAAAARHALHEIDDGTADLIVSHGQTVFHWVEGDQALGTLQLGQPAAIVAATGLPVVSDVRARDIAGGGQGAPLASTLDVLLLRARAEPAAALNLGGIANVTVVPRHGDALAFDTGPASCLIDATITRLTDGEQTYDVDGAWARRGRVDSTLLERLLDEPFYGLEPPRSTGRELFSAAYAERAAELVSHQVADYDLLATLTELTAVTIANALEPYQLSGIYASGGGVHNGYLMERLQRALGRVALRRSEDLGLPADGKEAYLMALIGYLTWHGFAGVLPGMTGATRPHVLGRVAPAGTSPRVPASLTLVG